MEAKMKYKQYFTPDGLAKVMVDIIPECMPHSIIDLSMGECSLLKKASARWKCSALFGADIDGELFVNPPENIKGINTYHCDSLSEELYKWDCFNEVIKRGGYDLALANPPFDYKNQDLVKVGDIRLCLPLETRFLIRNIDVVKNGGLICIIMPSSILSAEKLQRFRMYLAGRVDILKIVKVFHDCFENVDADICILVLRKKKQIERVAFENTEFFWVDQFYNLHKMFSQRLFPEKRWDADYYMNQESRCSVNLLFEKKKFLEYVSDIKRGKTLAGKNIAICEHGKKYIHTTNVKILTISSNNIRYLKKEEANEIMGNCSLKREQLLIGRVGRGCIGKVAVVTKRYVGSFFSDCLYSVTLKNLDPYYAALYFASKVGRMQLNIATIGSCGKYITKEGLMNIDIYIPEEKVQKYYSQKVREILSMRGRVDKEKLITELVEVFNRDLEKR